MVHIYGIGFRRIGPLVSRILGASRRSTCILLGFSYMTETMLTKVARVTVEETGFKWASSPQSSWRATVKAAVQAMREPTDVVKILAAEKGLSLEDYQAIIDIILSEPAWPRRVS